MSMGNSSTTTSSSDTQPWQTQQNYLEDAFFNAQDNYNTTLMNRYSGDMIAAPTQQQRTANDGAYNWGTGLYGTSNNMLGTGSNLVNQGAQTSQNAANTLGSLSGTTSGQLGNMASQIASGYDVKGATDAATYGAYRTAAEQTVPNLYRGSAATGNINSDRTALAQGVVDRGLAENYQNTYATLNNQNYQNSLSSAQNLLNSNASAASSQGSLGNNLGALGNNAVGTGITAGTNAANTATAGANANQQLDQSVLDNNREKIEYQNDQNQKALQNYYNIIGGTNWGSQTQGTSTTQQDPGIMSMLGGGLGILGKLGGK